MRKPLPILQTLHSSGTAYGIHRWMTEIECGRKAEYYRSLIGYRGLSGETDKDAGTIFHAFMAMYHKRKGARLLDTSAMISADLGNDAYTIAERCFRAYRANFQPNRFGKVLAVETEHRAPDGFLPVPLTIKPDLVTQLGRYGGQPGVRSGAWIIDHKLRKNRNPMHELRDEQDSQFTVYPLVWNELFPKLPVRGTCVNITYRTDPVTFELRYIPLLPQRIWMLDKQLRVARERFANHKGEPNKEACFNYNRVCEFSDQCTRY